MLTPNQAVLLIAACVTVLAIGYGVSCALHRPAVQSFDKGNTAGCLFWELLSIAAAAGGTIALCRLAEFQP